MRTLEDRFDEKYEVITEGGCWIWTGSLNTCGYGQIRVGSSLKLAHRVSYERYKQVIPANMLVLHRCDAPSCVNPDHLFLGTNAINTLDMISKDRQHKPIHIGEKNPRAKLTEVLVEEIRELYSTGEYGNAYLAEMYRTTKENIYRIVTRRTWKEI